MQGLAEGGARKTSAELSVAVCGVVGGVGAVGFPLEASSFHHSTELELNHWRIAVILWSLSFLFSLSSSFSFCPAVLILQPPPTSTHIKKIDASVAWGGERERRPSLCS